MWLAWRSACLAGTKPRTRPLCVAQALIPVFRKKWRHEDRKLKVISIQLAVSLGNKRPCLQKKKRFKGAFCLPPVLPLFLLWACRCWSGVLQTRE